MRAFVALDHLNFAHSAHRRVVMARQGITNYVLRAQEERLFDLTALRAHVVQCFIGGKSDRTSLESSAVSKTFLIFFRSLLSLTTSCFRLTCLSETNRKLEQRILEALFRD